MKSEIFNMRMSEKTREMLDKISSYYNLSASATIDYLIAKEFRLREKSLNVSSKDE